MKRWKKLFDDAWRKDDSWFHACVFLMPIVAAEIGIFANALCRKFL
jgi:hypothetical protein